LRDRYLRLFDPASHVAVARGTPQAEGLASFHEDSSPASRLAGGGGGW